MNASIETSSTRIEATEPSSPLLETSGLEVTHVGRRGKPAVSNVNLQVGEGETLGLVGESGSGKSTIGRAILGLTKPSGGRITFAGEDITSASRRRRRDLARDLQVIFQDPRSSLNEAKTIQQILIEPVVANRSMTRQAATEHAAELLTKVGLAEGHLRRRPRDFSGGQRQRIAIARALMSNPRLIICDEPVSALDLTVQAQIINLFLRLQRETRVSYLFIAHDLAVVRILASRVAVIAGGEIVEHGDTAQVYDNPSHPYTERLLAATPLPDPAQQRERRRLWDEMRERETASANDNPGQNMEEW